MARGESLTRRLKLAQLIDRRRAFDIAGVAEELGSSERTIYRDLRVLETAGLPLYADHRGPRARWRVVEGHRGGSALAFSLPELLALSLAGRMLEPVADDALAPALQSAVGKIRASLPAEVVARLAEAESLLSAAAGRVTRGERHAGARLLLDAVRDGHSVLLRSRKDGARRASGREVDPYHLHVQAGALYLVGWCHRRRDFRTFAVDRMTDVEPTRHRFERRPFTPAAFLQGALGPWEGRPVRIALRFSARVADVVASHPVHASQSFQLREDGALDVELACPVCPPLERWILGFAGDVEVLAPKGLVRRVHDAHTRAAGGREASGRGLTVDVRPVRYGAHVNVAAGPPSETARPARHKAGR